MAPGYERSGGDPFTCRQDAWAGKTKDPDSDKRMQNIGPRSSGIRTEKQICRKRMCCSAYLNRKFYIMGRAFWSQHLTTILAATSCPGCRCQIMRHSSRRKTGDAGQSCHEPALWGGGRLSKKSSSLFPTHELNLTLESDIWDA